MLKWNVISDISEIPSSEVLAIHRSENFTSSVCEIRINANLIEGWQHAEPPTHYALFNKPGIGTPHQKFTEINFGEIKNRIFQCLEPIENLELELDAEMIGKFVKIEKDGSCVYLTFDTTGFDDHNDMYAKSNYYDLNGRANLTAKQAKHWPKDGQHTMCFCDEDMFSDYFEAME